MLYKYYAKLKNNRAVIKVACFSFSNAVISLGVALVVLCFQTIFPHSLRISNRC